MKRSIVVIGGGIVGVSTALALKRRGCHVKLIDRRAPGQETSYGNAGVLTRASAVTLNNPSLFYSLPKMLTNKSSSLRFNIPFLLRNISWTAQFLGHAQHSRATSTARALDALISLSIEEHQHLIELCQLQERLRDQGWIHLYRSQASFERTAFHRPVWKDLGVDAVFLDGADLADLEPGLNPIFPKATWFRDTFSVDNPGAVVARYADEFVACGGDISLQDVHRLTETDKGAELTLSDGQVVTADQAVVCLGPWSRTFLERQGFKVQMAYERGYHRHFSGHSRPGSNLGLQRPIYDTGGGYVLSPQEQGLRLTSGVELNHIDAAPNYAQIEQSEALAREALDLGERLDETPWMGRRPTFPDSCPAIGLLPGTNKIYAGFGHQHIGFMTGPGTGRLLAELMHGEVPAIDLHPFRPERFIRRRS